MKKQSKTVILLGSGSLKIGEAGEFDYSGTQAIYALKEEGVRVVLVNPNVATIQTSQGLADSIYFLPVTADFVTKVIEKEKPHGIVLSFGGQTALNCGIELYERGVLKKHDVRVLGTPLQAIIDTEDRERFSKRLMDAGLKTAKGKVAVSPEAAVRVARALGYPVMVRAGFALGGLGSGIADDEEALRKILTNAFSLTHQVIVEESLRGWKELEYEVMRDCRDNCLIICNMENMDPIGIHTGESIVVAPSQTLSNDDYFSLRQVAIDVIRMLGIIGECNIQFAINPRDCSYRIIEVNARLSRSSALASKATGYPIAYIAAKLALGQALPELTNQITQKTSAFFEPALDYIVVKIPRWDLDKFINVDTQIGSEMKSVGEVMGIGRSFAEAIQKATRMLSDGYAGVIDPRFGNHTKTQLLKKLKQPDSMRLFTICSALRAGVSVQTIHNLTGVDPWFLTKLNEIVATYLDLHTAKTVTPALLRQAKQDGFSDSQIGLVTDTSEAVIRRTRLGHGIKPTVKHIDTLAGEMPAKTNYLYLTYHGVESDHVPRKATKKAIVLGSGPYAIGTSVEFDWCAVNTVKTLKERGWNSVVVNCNPETVSTDYSHSDTLYFEELSFERVMDIYEIEMAPFILSVGGQVPNNLASKLGAANVPILGSQPPVIYRAEHRKLFSRLLDQLGIAQPAWARHTSLAQATRAAKRLGYPVLVRPSFVLSGKAMAIIHTQAELVEYVQKYLHVSRDYPLVMTKYLERALECDFDGVAQNGNIILSALSEHVEPAGVHSGDSAIIQPAFSFSGAIEQAVAAASGRVVKALGVSGPFNIQCLIDNGDVLVIECNLRASRSFPFVSKVLGVNFIEVATRVSIGERVDNLILTRPSYFGVKVPQFSFRKLRGADPVLYVEMRSTGEVAGFGRDPYEAYLKGILATGVAYPSQKKALVSLGGMSNKLGFLYGCQKLVRVGFTLFATSGTSLFLKENGIANTTAGKISETYQPNVLDLLKTKQVDFAVIIPEDYTISRSTLEAQTAMTEGYLIRRTTTDRGIPLFTNAHSALFFIQAVTKYTIDTLPVIAWEEYQSKS